MHVNILTLDSFIDDGNIFHSSGKKTVNERTMADMACNLVLHHVHDDEISRLHDAIEQHLNTIKQQENDYDRLKRTTTESQVQISLSDEGKYLQGNLS